MQISIVAPSAHPVFSLPPYHKSVSAFEVTLVGDVKGVDFSNISTKQQTAVLWIQDSAGNHKVNYGKDVEGACSVVPYAGARTVQFLESRDGMMFATACQTDISSINLPIYFTLQTFSLIATALMLAMVLLSWRRLRA